MKKHGYPFWKGKGDEATETKNITEKFCADHIKKLKAKKIQVNYFLQTHGTISGGTWASFLNSVAIKKSILKITPSENKSYKTKKLYFDKNLNKWGMISIFLAFLILSYFYYNRKGKAEEIFRHKPKFYNSNVLSIILTISISTSEFELRVIILVSGPQLKRSETKTV